MRVELKKKMVVINYEEVRFGGVQSCDGNDGWKMSEVGGKRESGLRRSSGVQVRSALARRERRRCRRMIKSGTGVFVRV